MSLFELQGSYPATPYLTSLARHKVSPLTLFRRSCSIFPCLALTLPPFRLIPLSAV